MGAQIELFAGPPAKSHGLTETDIDEMFARFWEVYPRHEAKKDARKAYGQIIKAGEATEVVIMQGTLRYVAAIESRGTTAKHICLPATFIRGARYTDDFGSKFERGSSAVAQHSSFSRASAAFSGHRNIPRRRAVQSFHREAGMVVYCGRLRIGRN